MTTARSLVGPFYFTFMMAFVIILLSETALGQPSARAEKPTLHPALRVMPRALSMIPGNPPVIEEIGLLDYQLEELQQIEYDFRKQLSDLARTSRNATAEDRQNSLDNAFADLEESVSKVLLPKQFERLRQVALQSLAISQVDGQMNLPNLLANAGVQKTLEIDARTISAMRSKMKEENERIANEIANLKREAEESVLQLIPEEKRTQLKELVGEPFDFQGYRSSKGGRFRQAKDDDH